MGILKPCLSVSGDSVEIAVIEMYDEAQARALAPGFDDVLGEPFLADGDDDGIGERVRPGTVVEVLGKLRFQTRDDQEQDGTGNAPTGSAMLTVTEFELKKQGLLVDGVVKIRPNDRLLRMKKRDGEVRVDLAADGADGYHVHEVRPGETGSGIVQFVLERRRPVV